MKIWVMSNDSVSNGSNFPYATNVFQCSEVKNNTGCNIDLSVFLLSELSLLSTNIYI